MINTCRLCHANNLKLVLTLGNQALSDFTDKVEKSKKFPLDLLLCRKCSLVQLGYSVNPSLMYTDHYGYRSGINNTMKLELKSIVQSVGKYVKLKKGDLVIDIGCNDGTLLSNYPDKILTVGFDPVKKFAKESRQKAKYIVPDYFSREAFEKNLPKKLPKAKVISAIAMFYDLEDPNAFMKDVVSLLDEDGILIIQQNYLYSMLKSLSYDNICHEHLEYYSIKSMQYLFKNHGLEIIDVETGIINGGSFRVVVAKEGKFKARQGYSHAIKQENKAKLDSVKTYKDFAKKVVIQKDKLISFVKRERVKGKSFALYGASTRGNVILQYCGLDNTNIDFAVERNPEKFGKFITSVGIPIVSEEEGRKRKPDYMIVLPWFFKEEFLKREKAYLTHGGKFIFPLPKFEVVAL